MIRGNFPRLSNSVSFCSVVMNCSPLRVNVRTVAHTGRRLSSLTAIVESCEPSFSNCITSSRVNNSLFRLSGTRSSTIEIRLFGASS